MKLKEVKDKTDKLTFFLSYVETSKTRVLQLLRKEINKLDNIQNLKESNLGLLNAIEERWFVKKGITFFEKNPSNFKAVARNKVNSTIYFLVDPKKMDIYTKNMLKKMEEVILETVTPDDYIVTFGSNVNLMCQKLELNVIEHFDYSVYEDFENFSQRVSALIEIGIKNNLFNKAMLMIAQVSKESYNKIISRQILPFENFAVKSNSKSEKNIDEEDKKNNTFDINESLEGHKKVVSNINIGKAEWNPDIYVLHEQLTKTIIKQGIYETKVISDIEQYNLELHLLEEKKHKLTDQKANLILLYNKARKEESTLQSLLLYTAFKIRKDDEEEVHLFNINNINKGATK
ncbi:MAG: MMOB1630 family gliding motility ATPase complex subunit [Metamycoplasmataceae bacterium]